LFTLHPATRRSILRPLARGFTPVEMAACVGPGIGQSSCCNSNHTSLHAGVASGLIEGVDAKTRAAIESICDIMRRSNWAGPFNEEL
jgi:hypothetical protein